MFETLSFVQYTLCWQCLINCNDIDYNINNSYVNECMLRIATTTTSILRVLKFTLKHSIAFTLKLFLFKQTSFNIQQRNWSRKDSLTKHEYYMCSCISHKGLEVLRNNKYTSCTFISNIISPFLSYKLVNMSL